MKLKQNIKLFAKLFFGIANDQERKEIFRSEESIQMMEEDWKKSEKSIGRSEKDKAETFSLIKRNILNLEIKVSSLKKLSVFLRKYAAILLLAASFLTAGAYIFLKDISKKEIVYISKENPRGNRSEFLLPDGTKVWLNSESKLVYPETFSQNERKVTLTGEAFFQVKKNKEKPFKVFTNDILIEVLGTSFNVSAYPNEDKITTTLVTGKVGVSDKHTKDGKKHRFVMDKEHKAVFNKNDRQFTIDKVNVIPLTSWKEGKLMFDDVPFSEMIKILERSYDVSFISGVEYLADYRYKLTITNESIEEIMQLIQKTTPINYRIDGKEIYVYPK